MWAKGLKFLRTHSLASLLPWTSYSLFSTERTEGAFKIQVTADYLSLVSPQVSDQMWFLPFPMYIFTVPLLPVYPVFLPLCYHCPYHFSRWRATYQFVSCLFLFNIYKLCGGKMLTFVHCYIPNTQKSDLNIKQFYKEF